MAPSRSFTTLHRQTKNSSLGKIRIVIKPRNFEPAQRQHSFVKGLSCGTSQFPESLHGHKPHTFDLLSGRINRAQVNRLTKTEIVGVKETTFTVRQRGVAENFQQRLFHV